MEKLKEEYLYDRDGNTEIRNEHNTTLNTPPSGLLFASVNHNKQKHQHGAHIVARIPQNV
jgi:hypothetical protein